MQRLISHFPFPRCLSQAHGTASDTDKDREKEDAQATTERNATRETGEGQTGLHRETGGQRYKNNDDNYYLHIINLVVICLCSSYVQSDEGPRY